MFEKNSRVRCICLHVVGFGDCGWSVRPDGPSQSGTAKQYWMDSMRRRPKRVVRSSLAGGTHATVETLDMLEFTKVFYFLFLDPLKSLRDVESIFEKYHKSRVIIDAKSLYDALERSESSARNRKERGTAIGVTAISQ